MNPLDSEARADPAARPRRRPFRAVLRTAGVAFVAVAVLAALGVGGCFRSKDPLAGVPTERQLRIGTADGRQRTAVLVVPTGDAPPEGWPLVVMLHGAGGSTRNVLEATRWDTLAEREGFVVVFPNGTPIDEAKPERFVGNPQTWNSGAGTSLAAGDRSAEAKAIDDVAFLGQLIDRVRGRTAIDGRRIYLAGHSNGAGMAYRFASERPELLAAVGVMAGHLAEGLRDLRSPVSLIAISGDRDPFAPLEGGEAGTPRLKMRTRPARLNSSDWAKANGLPDDPQSVRDDEALLVRQWGPNEAGTEVRWIVVRNHGHAWAGGSESLPESIIGPGSTALDATREMWEFFKAHPTPRGHRTWCTARAMQCQALAGTCRARA